MRAHTRASHLHTYTSALTPTCTHTHSQGTERQSAPLTCQPRRLASAPRSRGLSPRPDVLGRDTSPLDSEGRKPRGARAQRARPRQGSARADSTLRDSRRREARPCGAVGEPGAAGGRAPPLVRAMGTAPRAAGRPPRGRRAAKCVQQHTSRTPRLRQASYASDGAGGTCPSSAL